MLAHWYLGKGFLQGIPTLSTVGDVRSTSRARHLTMLVRSNATVGSLPSAAVVLRTEQWEWEYAEKRRSHDARWTPLDIFRGPGSANRGLGAKNGVVDKLWSEKCQLRMKVSLDPIRALVPLLNLGGNACGPVMAMCLSPSTERISSDSPRAFLCCRQAIVVVFFPTDSSRPLFFKATVRNLYRKPWLLLSTCPRSL